MSSLTPKPTQAEKVLRVLEDAKGDWVSGRYFLQSMLLSQYHARIFELQNDRERYEYNGSIEASEWKDEYGYKAYRLAKTAKQLGLKL